MKKYTVVGQNVWVTDTSAFERVPELLCIATNQDNAIDIASSMNVIESYKTTTDEKQG